MSYPLRLAQQVLAEEKGEELLRLKGLELCRPDIVSPFLLLSSLSDTSFVLVPELCQEERGLCPRRCDPAHQAVRQLCQLEDCLFARSAQAPDYSFETRARRF